MNGKKIAGIAVAVLIVLAVVGVVGYFITSNSVLSQGNKQETDISAVYVKGATTLSECTTKTKQAANVASAHTDALDKVIRAAVAGSVGSDGHVTQQSLDNARGGFYAAFVQAYPDTKDLSKTFNNVMAVVTGCQHDFKTAQDAVQDRVRAFKAWLTGSWTTRTFGGDLPNDVLELNLPNQAPITGKAALIKVSTPILDSATAGAYSGNGTYDPGTPFSTSAPTPAPTTTSHR
ncbi:MAG TPA: hypothetical protein VLG40_01320 [Candidatus Saccharimonas sp.]|nr:hypothetical protein [Candidatus Saccharimonas sp.]